MLQFDERVDPQLGYVYRTRSILWLFQPDKREHT